MIMIMITLSANYVEGVSSFYSSLIGILKFEIGVISENTSSPSDMFMERTSVLKGCH